MWMDYRNYREENSLSASTSHNALFQTEREPQPPLITGPMPGMPPVVTGPMVTGAPTVTPLPFQVPLNPGQYPAFYEVPMTIPYPVRAFDPNGYEVGYPDARFFPFFPPRPFFFPPVFFPPYWI